MTDRIMKRVRAKGRGWVFTPRHFVDFGTRGAVDMALSRLAKAGNIRRVGRGLYDYPRQHDKLGALSPDPDSMAAALAIQSGDSLAPSGPAAANSLGISTQVPAKVSYATSGRSRTKRAGGRSLTLRHSRAPVLDDAPDSANAVVQALAYLGKDQIDAAVIARFAQRIDDRDMKALLQARPQMSNWMGDVVLKIDAARHG
jgi:predicted transcriptional regulator of viral defense system